eukprot:m.342156 g.342156  ORF g.342156 m.342156 type:complete len:360 (-) comp21030_c0_seq1:110-1189(-)
MAVVLQALLVACLHIFATGHEAELLSPVSCDQAEREFLCEECTQPIVEDGEYMFGLEVFTQNVNVSVESFALVDMKDKLLQMLEKYKVLVFRGLGEKLSMHDHVSFARSFGPVHTRLSQPPPYIFSGVHVSVPDPSAKKDHSLQASVVNEREKQLKSGEPEEVFKIVVSPNNTYAFGEGWHTDITYEQTPPKAAVLIARRVPPYGLGNTLFLDACRMYDSMPEAFKKEIENVYAVHSNRAGHVTVRKIVQVQVNNDGESKPVLFINRHFVSQLVDEDTVKEFPNNNNTIPEPSEQDPYLLDLLNRLLDYVDSFGEEHGIKVSWNAGDLAVWHEPTTQHAGHYDYHGYWRELHRVLVAKS